MREYSEPIIRPFSRSRHENRWWPLLLAVASVLAILFQVYVPMFFSYLAYLELPLLATVHFALVRRSPVAGLMYGAALGLFQDAFSGRPLGMFGIAKTLIGFFAANVSLRMDVENPAVRFLLGFFFYVMHHVLYWLLSNALLGGGGSLEILQALIFGLLNGAVAVPLFQLLDRL
jgi:rod shape-determining protein MreD